MKGEGKSQGHENRKWGGKKSVRKSRKRNEKVLVTPGVRSRLRPRGERGGGKRQWATQEPRENVTGVCSSEGGCASPVSPRLPRSVARSREPMGVVQDEPRLTGRSKGTEKTSRKTRARRERIPVPSEGGGNDPSSKTATTGGGKGRDLPPGDCTAKKTLANKRV